MRLRNWVFTAMMLLTSAVNADVLIAKGEVRLPPPGTSVAAAYFELSNTSNQEIELASITSSAARHTMFHRIENVDGVMKMRHVDTINVPANSMVEFSPGALHVMMMGVGPLEEGTELAFEIVLGSGESIQFTLPVVAQ
jgi:hypothetical protein